MISRAASSRLARCVEAAPRGIDARSNSARKRITLPVTAIMERSMPETIPVHVWMAFRLMAFVLSRMWNRSEREAYGQLDTACRTCSYRAAVADRCDASERRQRGEVRVRPAQLRVVEHVEDFHAERQVGFLCDVYDPGQCSVDLEETGAVDNVLARAPPRANSRDRESGWVDPSVDGSTSGRNQGNTRHAVRQLVRAVAIREIGRLTRGGDGDRKSGSHGDDTAERPAPQ